jgi:uncharacterized LabA/DUF88 family protein
MNQLHGPLPHPRRMMIFFDGENLVARYQAMLKDGWMSRPDMVHVRDSLLYGDGMANLTQIGFHEILRATYYTSTTGDEAALTTLAQQIKSLTVSRNRSASLPCNLTPQVFKRDKGTSRSKGVDIKLTVDVLTQVHNDTVDSVYILSGDGDFLPVMEEVLRHGKQLYVSAFSSGLNARVRQIADQFYLLDYHVFPQGGPSAHCAPSGASVASPAMPETEPSVPSDQADM